MLDAVLRRYRGVENRRRRRDSRKSIENVVHGLRHAAEATKPAKERGRSCLNNCRTTGRANGVADKLLPRNVDDEVVVPEEVGSKDGSVHVRQKKGMHYT